MVNNKHLYYKYHGIQYAISYVTIKINTIFIINLKNHLTVSIHAIILPLASKYKLINT